MDLHPVARQVLEAFAPQRYFRSNLLCHTIAARNPEQSVRWAVDLVKPRVDESSPHNVVTETLQTVDDAIRDCSTGALSVLDELAWKSWSSDSFDDSSPYLQRAVARLAWATMCLICHVTSQQFESQFVGIHLAPSERTAFTEMVNECAMAIDLTCTQSDDGRMMVAASFSREMGR